MMQVPRLVTTSGVPKLLSMVGLRCLPKSPNNMQCMIRKRVLPNGAASRMFGAASLHEDETESAPKEGSLASSCVNVADIANEIRASVRDYAGHYSRIGSPIKLVGILADGPFSHHAELYSHNTAKTCREDGIDYELWRVASKNPSEVEAIIRKANDMPDVHGILVYYPIFQKQPIITKDTKMPGTRRANKRTALDDDGQRRGPYKNRLTGVYYKTHDDYLRDVICRTRDVEGLCHDYNARWMFRRSNLYVDHEDDDEDDSDRSDDCCSGVIFPCTALSVVRILERCHEPYRPQQPVGRRFEGTVVTVVNRSEVLGRPLAAMLANDGATVYSIDVDSILMFRPGGRLRRCMDPSVTMEWCIEQSSVVVTGVPSEDYQIPCDRIRPNTTVVNVAEHPNVNEDAVLAIPGVQYIPHVGKVTVAVLEHNLIHLHKRHHAPPPE